MFQEVSTEIQFFIAIALTAGAISVAISALALPDRVKEPIAPMLLFLSSISSIFFILSSILSTIQIFISISLMIDLSFILFFSGMIVLSIPVIYLLFKLLKVELALRF